MCLCHPRSLNTRSKGCAAQGMYVNARNAAGDTPLHVATAAGQEAAAHALLVAGADPELRNALGLRPKDMAPGSVAPPPWAAPIAKYKRLPGRSLLLRGSDCLLSGHTRQPA
jgi:ankyrin repeat protein